MFLGVQETVQEVPVKNTGTVVYPPEFVEEVKQMFPDLKSLHALLDANEYFVGRYLSDAEKSISPDRVLQALNNGQAGLVALRQHALRLKRTSELYAWWGDIVDSQ